MHTPPDLFDPCAHGPNEKDEVVTSYVLDEEEVRAHGGDVIANKNRLLILNNTFLLSGEVPRNTACETGLPNEFWKINGL